MNKDIYNLYMLILKGKAEISQGFNDKIEVRYNNRLTRMAIVDVYVIDRDKGSIHLDEFLSYGIPWDDYDDWEWRGWK